MNEVEDRDQRREEVTLRIGSVALEGSLTNPHDAGGVVVFAHGSGSSRFSSRNQYVARVLHLAGLATLLFDLLTKEEESVDAWTGHLRFDIGFLAQRLAGATDWIATNQETEALPIGYFGASTGAAAALVAAAERTDIRAVVSRGGRPDLAGSSLEKVTAPTLLIVGGNDVPVIPLNDEALERIGADEKRLEIVPGATHLFEEPGALEEVASLASQWFRDHLVATRGEQRSA